LDARHALEKLHEDISAKSRTSWEFKPDVTKSVFPLGQLVGPCTQDVSSLGLAAKAWGGENFSAHIWHIQQTRRMSCRAWNSLPGRSGTIVPDKVCLKTNSARRSTPLPGDRYWNNLLTFLSDPRPTAVSPLAGVSKIFDTSDKGIVEPTAASISPSLADEVNWIDQGPRPPGREPRLAVTGTTWLS
jgi:hypothetical protein